MSETNGSYFVSRTMRVLQFLAVEPRSCAELSELVLVHPRTIRRASSRPPAAATAATSPV
jgi:hypothetical protein